MDHILEIYSKPKKILGLIYRDFYNYSSSDTLKQLYLSLAHLHLEYAAQLILWDPYTQSEIDKLEAPKKFALNYSTHQWDVNYDELLKLTGIPRLSVRRQPEGLFQPLPAYSKRLARRDTISRPFAQTNYFYHSFESS